jgi:geranylgeranyl pyrophosphate synthase
MARQIVRRSHESVYERMRETAKMVNPRIVESLEPLKREHPGLYEVVSHLPRVKVGERFGASMLRPTLVRFGCEAVGGGNFGAVVPLATAVELLNISTYVIDDIFDNCDLRHSEVTVHVKYGSNNAIIAGFILRELAAKEIGGMLLDAQQHRKLRDLHEETHYTIYSGQFHDLKLNERTDVSIEEYLERTYKITGAFIQNCILMGAIAAGADEQTLDELKEFGKSYGIAVQIRNDLMDFALPDARLAASRGFKGCTHADFKAGKMTLPVIHALHSGGEDVRMALLAALGRPEATEDELHGASRLMDEIGSFDYTRGIVKEYREKALAALETLPETTGKSGLRQLAVILNNVDSWKFS